MPQYRRFALGLGVMLAFFGLFFLAVGENPLAPISRSLRHPRGRFDPRFTGVERLPNEIKEQLFEGVPSEFRDGFADAVSVEDAFQIRKRLLEIQENKRTLDDRWIIVIPSLIGAAILLSFWGIAPVFSQLTDSSSKIWHRLIRTRDKIPLTLLIILAATLPLVLVCLVFMVNLGWRNPARNHPWVWLLVILVTASFQWFVWGVKSSDDPKEPPRL